RNGLIAKIGKHSLAIYVLHGFVVRGLQPVLDDSRDVLPDAIVFLICLALAVVWTGVLSWTPFERALRWYASTASRLILKPFSALWSRTRWAASSPADSQGGPDAPAASGGLGGLGGIDGPEGPGDVDGSGDRHGEDAHPAAHDLAHPAPFEHYPLPGSHEVPQTAAAASARAVPARAAPPTARRAPRAATRSAAQPPPTPRAGAPADRHRRRPVCLGPPADEADRRPAGPPRGDCDRAGRLGGGPGR